jgi:hypothetical protein
MCHGLDYKPRGRDQTNAGLAEHPLSSHFVLRFGTNWGNKVIRQSGRQSDQTERNGILQHSTTPVGRFWLFLRIILTRLATANGF